MIRNSRLIAPMGFIPGVSLREFKRGAQHSVLQNTQELFFGSDRQAKWFLLQSAYNWTMFFTRNMGHTDRIIETLLQVDLLDYLIDVIRSERKVEIVALNDDRLLEPSLFPSYLHTVRAPGSHTAPGTARDIWKDTADYLERAASNAKHVQPYDVEE